MDLVSDLDFDMGPDTNNMSYINKDLRRQVLQRRNLAHLVKSHAFREEIIGALPIDRLRPFFRMNPDSFLFVLDQIRL